MECLYSLILCYGTDNFPSSLPPFIKEGWGGFFLARVPSLFQRGGWGKFQSPLSPFIKGGREGGFGKRWKIGG